MAAADNRSTEDVRRDIATEREQLADAVDDLRAGIGEAANLRGRLPLIAASALGAGFVLAGGVGATMRFVARRGREGRERVKLGRFSIVDRS
jgi:4-hydroxy-3-methylbut-2-en-1-yl diphosphate synthase IspG/GcpE